MREQRAQLCRFQRLAHKLDASGSGGFGDELRAVGGDDQRRHRAAEIVDIGDCRGAQVAAVEMLVGDEDVGNPIGVSQKVKRIIGRGGGTI